MKREKRLEKGIDSIDKQIKLHEEKRIEALEEQKIDLADYFEKEIEALRVRKRNREDKLNR